MSALVSLRLAHIVLAVLGAGSFGALAVAARAASRVGSSDTTLLTPLALLARAGLGLTFLTGAALGFAAGGALHEHWWFRLSGIFTIAAGVLVGLVGRRLRRSTNGDAAALEPVARLAYGAAALVAGITVLMVLRPG